MAQVSLSVLIRQGYLEALQRIPPGCGSSLLPAFPQTVRDRAVPVAEREALWTFALERYRAGESLWGPIILEALAPRVVKLAARYQPLPPLITSEEISQQVVLEVLHAARHIPLWSSPKWTPSRITLRATKRLERWFDRAVRLENDEVSWALLDSVRPPVKGRRPRTVAAAYIPEHAKERS